MLFGEWAGSKVARVLFMAGAVIVIAAIFAVNVFYNRIREQTADLAAQMVGQTEAAFEQIPTLDSDEAGALRTYRNAEHVERARVLGIERPEDRAEAAALVQQDSLVALADNAYYRVRHMDHSVPYVTRSTAHLLDLIGAAFHQALAEAGLPAYRYVITSATRTREDQERLQGVNVNAATLSSHEFGTTVDITYSDFDLVPDLVPQPEESFWIAENQLQETLTESYGELTEERTAKLKALLGRVLRDLQRENKVLVIYERRQTVYHITLGEPMDAPAPVEELGPRVGPADSMAGEPPALAEN